MGTTTITIPILHSIIYSSALLLILAAAAKERCHPEDKKTLLQIQKNFNVDLFTTTPSTDCCTWPLVTCDPAANNRVTTFSAFASNLPGTISPAIGDLHYLKTIDLHNLPNITGPIPATLSKLKHLEFLRLDQNSLTGSIPDVLHTLSNLSYINLSFNQLSGSIPPSIALGPSLDYLRLDRNRLTGSIPANFGQIKNHEIYSLHLSHNQLSGPIPSSLGNLNITNILDLSRNNLTGDASFLFGKFKTVNQMDLSRNQLEFDFSKVEVPTEIEWLLLEHNKIYGSLPPSLAGLPRMNDFNVSYNRLCGKIPPGLENQFINEYSFFHNKCLCGSPLDACK